MLTAVIHSPFVAGLRPPSRECDEVRVNAGGFVPVKIPVSELFVGQIRICASPASRN